MVIPSCLSIRAVLDRHGMASIVFQLKLRPLGVPAQPFGGVLDPVSA
jgi:hypothetical protein